MSAVAIKDGEVREVIRSRQSTRFATGLRWCPWCDHSSQLDRGVCRGCGAIFEENYEAPAEEPAGWSRFGQIGAGFDRYTQRHGGLGP